jgi:hypothetical protein
MVDDVAKIILHAGADLRHAAAVKLAGAFEQRRARTSNVSTNSRAA